MFSPFAKTPVSALKQKLNKSSSYFSPMRRSVTPSVSRNSSFQMSFQESFLGENSDHRMEVFGLPLPVQVAEAVHKAENLSVKLESFGYASLVYGRQLLIWKFKDDGSKNLIHCMELPLPPSDLAHKAELVHLLRSEDAVPPSALAVSPEGHVRYWPSINHPGSSVDAQPDLQGQECYSLTPVSPLGCILATTTSSLIIITPTFSEGQPNVICRPLSLPVGMLAGISRKVSSFIFGVVPTQNSETKQLSRVLSVKSDNGDNILHVLSNNAVQKWLIRRDENNSDELLFDTDLDRSLKQNYTAMIFKDDKDKANHLPHLKIWCLDIQLCRSGVAILSCGVFHSGSDANMYYALSVLNTSSNTPPENLSTFQVIFNEPYQQDVEEKLLSFKLLLPCLESPSAYVYNVERIICVQLGIPQVESSEMNFANSGNIVFGSGSCDGTPLFFLKDYGIVSFSPNQKTLNDSRLLASMKDVSFKQSNPNEAPESLVAQLRTAMYLFCNGETEKCEKMISDIFSQGWNDLDEAVVSLSAGIIDDYPVSDPRWCESVPTGSRFTSLIISYQLEDKLKVHECLVNFLKAFKILDKLSTVKIHEYTIPTSILLCEHAEKLIAAKALRLFLTDEVIETAVVQHSLNKRNIQVKTHLTPQDVFFREVSAFHTIFSSLIDWESGQINEDESMSRTLSAIMTVNKVFLGLLEAISEYRQSKKEFFEATPSRNSEYLPWTSREGESGIRTHIRNQLDTNIQHGMSITDNIQIQGVLYQQYVEILDFFLDSYRLEIENSSKKHKSSREYNDARSKYLQKLLYAEQYERAAAIAEKHLEFDILVQICEETKNVDRLQGYMLQFSQQKFSEFVFKWYLEKGKKGKLFDRHLGQREVLGDFLQAHDSLKWLYYIQEEKFDAAHQTLKQLALSETQFLNRKKTLLSLSKLCAMISDAPQSTKALQIGSINLEHDLITHQEALPVAVVEACGIDPRNMRVFPPEELIEMYIAEENPAANAYDFKIALDLLNFIKKPSDDSDVSSLKIHIWSKAVLRDNWEALDVNNPIESVKETLFFQIIELAFDQGVEIFDFMPSIEDLVQSPELRDLSDNPSIKFLLQAGYEHIHKTVV